MEARIHAPIVSVSALAVLSRPPDHHLIQNAAAGLEPASSVAVRK
jgi:hypothetical protein